MKQQCTYMIKQEINMSPKPCTIIASVSKSSKPLSKHQHSSAMSRHTASSK